MSNELKRYPLCGRKDGDYCQDLAKYIIDLQSKMTSALQNT